MSTTHPYDYFDDPYLLDSIEHVAECNSGRGIPWASEPPGMKFRWFETGPTMRERLELTVKASG